MFPPSSFSRRSAAPSAPPALQAACDESRPEEEQLIYKYGIPITRKHARRLGPGVWLNDEIANFYLELVKVRHALRVEERAAAIAAAVEAGAPAPPPMGPCYIPNTIFWTKLTEDTREKGKVKEEGYCYANVQVRGARGRGGRRSL